MNLLSVPVLGAAALLAGPTLWQGLVVGAVPLEHSLSRYFVTVALVWAALSAVALLIEATGPPLEPARARARTDEAGPGRPSGEPPHGD